MKIKSKVSMIKELEKKLATSTKVVIPTDKNNYFKMIEIDLYKISIKEHLVKSGVFSSRERIVNAFKNAEDLLLGMIKLLSDDEISFIKGNNSITSNSYSETFN